MAKHVEINGKNVANLENGKKAVFTDDGFRSIQQEIQVDPENNLKFRIDKLDYGWAVKNDGVFVTKEVGTTIVPCIEKSDIVFNFDLQPRDITDGSPLIDDIWRRGLVSMPIAWERPDGAIELTRGHRRSDALSKMRTIDPDRFENLFPGGVATKVYVGLTEDDALLIRDDHDLDVLKRGLTTKTEVFNLLRPKFERKWTISKILSSDWRTIAQVMSGRYHELESNVAKATSDKEKYEIIYNSQAGNYLLMKAIFRAPDVLKAHWFAQERGDKVAKIKQDDIKKLASVFDNEVADGLKMIPIQKWTKENPGPKFKAEMQAVLDAVSSKSTDTNQRVKKMSELTSLASDVKSEIATYALQAAMNSPHTEEMLKKIDAIIAPVESAMKIDHSLIDMVCTLVIKRNAPVSDEVRSKIEKLLA